MRYGSMGSGWRQTPGRRTETQTALSGRRWCAAFHFPATNLRMKVRTKSHFLIVSRGRCGSRLQQKPRMYNGHGACPSTEASNMFIRPDYLIPQPPHHLKTCDNAQTMFNIQNCNMLTHIRPYSHTRGPSRLWQPPIVTVRRKPREPRSQLARTCHQGEQQRIPPVIVAHQGACCSKISPGGGLWRAQSGGEFAVSRQRREAG